MSLKKPIIKVTKECPNCTGFGYIGDDKDLRTEDCKKCNGIGSVDVRQNNPNFKKYYIKNLEGVIEYYTGSYRQKNKEAQEYLKEAKLYSKELDRVVNK